MKKTASLEWNEDKSVGFQSIPTLGLEQLTGEFENERQLQLYTDICRINSFTDLSACKNRENKIS